MFLSCWFNSVFFFLWETNISNYILHLFSPWFLFVSFLILPLPLPHIPLCFQSLPVFLLLFILSCSLCIIKADHLALEELHTAWLSCLPATKECWGQEEPAVWVSVSDQTMLYLYFTFFLHYTMLMLYHYQCDLFVKLMMIKGKLMNRSDVLLKTLLSFFCPCSSTCWGCCRSW